MSTPGLPPPDWWFHQCHCHTDRGRPPAADCPELLNLPASLQSSAGVSPPVPPLCFQALRSAETPQETMMAQPLTSQKHNQFLKYSVLMGGLFHYVTPSQESFSLTIFGLRYTLYHQSTYLHPILPGIPASGHSAARDPKQTSGNASHECQLGKVIAQSSLENFSNRRTWR